MAGSASHASGVFTVRGSGANVWDTADGFHFVYRPMTGDGQIVARVDSVTNTDPWAKAGVMMRDGLERGEANGFAFVSAGGNVRFQRRRTAGGTTPALYTGTASMPRWVKLVRTGDTLAAYFSSNGASWTSAGTNTFIMNSTIYVGLAVTSHKNSVLSTGVFRNVSVTSTGGGNSPPGRVSDCARRTARSSTPRPRSRSAHPRATRAARFSRSSSSTERPLSALTRRARTGPTVSNVVDGTYTLKAVAVDNDGATASSSTRTITVRPGVSPWENEDVGTVGAAGNATFSFNSVTVRGAGADIWGTADGFHFVYQTLAGNGEVVARVDSLQATDPWAKAGVMMREALSGGSPHASALVTGTEGIVFQRRSVPGGNSSSTAGSASSAPRWLRIARVGSTFTASESVNGTTWTVVGLQTITMAPTLYVGLAITSHRPGVLTTAKLSSITVRSTAVFKPAAVGLFDGSGLRRHVHRSRDDRDGRQRERPGWQRVAGAVFRGLDAARNRHQQPVHLLVDQRRRRLVLADGRGPRQPGGDAHVGRRAGHRDGFDRSANQAVFNPSPDHAVVTHYLLEIFRAGDIPGASPPVATRNMGKPAVVNNEISVDIATLITPLAPGNYIATVSSVNANGAGRSAPPSPFVR